MTSRIYGLDILRAAAIFSVVYVHGVSYVPSVDIQAYLYLFTFDGVSMFFVLSGFLVGGILLQIAQQPVITRHDLLSFWMRRWLRTLPAYYLVLIILILSSYVGQGVWPHKVYKYLTFTQNFANIPLDTYRHPYLWFYPEAWSLSVEEWFYFLIPLGLFTLINYVKIERKKLIFLFIVGSIILTGAFRLYMVFRMHDHSAESWDLYIRKVVVTRLDSIMFGVLGAYIHLYYKKYFFAWTMQSFLIGMGLLLFDKTGAYLFGLTLDYYRYFSLSVTAVGTLLLLPKLTTIKNGTGPIFKLITLISTLSYSMYLLNYTPIKNGLVPVLTRFFELEKNSVWILFAQQYLLYWGLTIGIAYLIYRFYELPIMNLRDSLPFSQKPKESA